MWDDKQEGCVTPYQSLEAVETNTSATEIGPVHVTVLPYRRRSMEICRYIWTGRLGGDFCQRLDPKEGDLNHSCIRGMLHLCQHFPDTIINNDPRYICHPISPNVFSAIH